MDTAAIVICSAVLKAASFRGAARQLGCPVPTIASAFRRVEADLAVDLAFQSGAGLTITFEARRLAPELADIASLVLSLLGWNAASEDGYRHAARHPLSFMALQRFIETIAAGSIRAAARRIGMGQPQLTRQLTLLEDRIGSPLLVRTPEGCHSTAIGERVSTIADELLRRWTVLTSTSAHDFRRHVTTLRLGSIVPLGHESQIAHMLAALVAAWKQPGRRMHLMLKSSTAEELITELKAGRLDFALIDMVANVADLDGIEISRSRLSAIGPPGFLARYGSVTEALNRGLVALPTARSGLRNAVKDLLNERRGRSDQTPENFTEIDSIPVIINLVRDHGYLSVMPRVSVEGIIGGIEVAELPAEFGLPIYLAWVKNRDLKRLGDELIKDLHALLSVGA